MPRILPAACMLLVIAASPALAQRLVRLEADEAAARMQRMRDTWSTQEQWLARAERVRAAILDVMDLPVAHDDRLARPADRGPLHAVVTDVRHYDGYVVEDVVFQSFPGTHVSGNLYRPADARGRHPGILCPHGHFRARDDDPEGRFRRDMQIRCAALARMGAIVFAYDMVGWGESDVADHHAPQALPLQTYNSIRALDYLCSRPEVDHDRLAVTGASGGATQTILLTALDDRIHASVPVVMVSSHFFGGCECETGMPIHSTSIETSNVEIAALAAPRPLLLVSCGKDWTSNTPDVEFPFIREVYDALGAEKNLAAAHFADEGHDYGRSKRIAMYEFLAEHLALDIDRLRRQDAGIDEGFVTIEPKDVLEVGRPVRKRSAQEAWRALRAAD